MNAGARWKLNKDKKNILHMCAFQCHLEALQYFLNEVGPSDINQTCKLGRTPLHDAMHTNKDDAKL